jgi:hypothetical protein
VHIHLEDSECIPLGIDEITLPTSLWDREFGSGDRLVIALHSPDGVIETGLRICLLEKMAAKPVRRNSRDTFSSPV